jgi:NAD(P)-dependent dehydrogenase (short-subunit alcohol dehydrogenase family)
VRVGRPEEVARSVLYAASDDSAFVTGTASLIDGAFPSRAPEQVSAEQR